MSVPRECAKVGGSERSGEAMMEFGFGEMIALVSSGAIGSLLVWGYQKWIKL